MPIPSYSLAVDELRIALSHFADIDSEKPATSPPAETKSKPTTKKMGAPSVEDRLSILEKKHHACPKGYEVDDSMRRARQDVESKALYSAVWKWVPSPYYGWKLDERAQFLTGSKENTKFLCKSLVMENKKWKQDEPNLNPRFVLVIVQYAATLNNKKLGNAIRTMRKNVLERIEESRFSFQIAASEDNDRLTGYKHNSVTPFGLLSSELVVVMSKELVDLKWFWMGGGHVDLKLKVATSEFIEKVKPVVADISDPRDGSADIED